MTSYLKAVVAALGTAIATLVAECADGHVTPLRLLVAAGTLVATFAAVYFTPNNQPPPPVVEPAPPVVVPAPITADAIAAKADELKRDVAGAQAALDTFLGAIATAAPPAPAFTAAGTYTGAPGFYAGSPPAPVAPAEPAAPPA